MKIVYMIIVSLVWHGVPLLGLAQNPQCDPTKVLTTETCVRCHGNEVSQWQKTPHATTFETLARNPRAAEITSRLGLSSVKRNDICLNCHFTVQDQDGKLKPIAGVSCESCHGASKDWLNVHNDYGGPLATKDSESSQHHAQRLQKSAELGMRNTTNVYAIARSCLGCHTAPNEKLVNVGGHHAGTETFELVAWSQGIVRHNFLHGNGANAEPSREKLRVMYVAGLIADLEFSTRGTAQATQKATYGVTVAERAGKVAMKLFEIQQLIQNPHLQMALEAFAQADLRTNNANQLLAIADQIQKSGTEFVATVDPASLVAIDAMLPSPSTYKN